MARRKTELNPENYYTIYVWMLTVLGLSKCELLVYAFIFAYSTNKNGRGCYFGGYEAMSLSTGYSTKNIQIAVQSLSECGLVEKKKITFESGAVRNYLRVNADLLKEKLSGQVEYLSDILESLQGFDSVWEDLQKINKKISKVKSKAKNRMF